MQSCVRLVCRHHTTYRYSRLAVGHTATVVQELWWPQHVGHQQNLLTTPSHACYLLWRSISWLLLGFGLISRFLSGSTLFGADIFRVHLSISSCWREENFFLQALDLGPGDLGSRSGFALGVPPHRTSVFASIEGKDWTRMIGLPTVLQKTEMFCRTFWGSYKEGGNLVSPLTPHFFRHNSPPSLHFMY